MPAKKLCFVHSRQQAELATHALPSREAVKEPHFLDFRQRKINKLQVKSCQF